MVVQETEPVLSEFLLPGEIYDPNDELSFIRQWALPPFSGGEQIEMVRKIQLGLRSLDLIQKIGDEQDIDLLHHDIEIGSEQSELLVRSYGYCLVKYAYKNAGKGLTQTELIQVGIASIQNGLKGYKEERGFAVSTYLITCVHNGMIRALVNLKSHFPEEMQLQYAQLRRIESKLTNSLLRFPTVEEIAYEAEMDSGSVREILDSVRNPIRLNLPISSESDEESNLLIEMVEDYMSIDPQEALEEKELPDDWQIVQDRWHLLKPLEEQIVKLYYRLDDRAPRARSIRDVYEVLHKAGIKRSPSQIAVDLKYALFALQ
jgi:DNA-directed RNA polymerase sigma subunit (sigma70/sigma32)